MKLHYSLQILTIISSINSLETVLYWGQNSSGNEKNLAYYCGLGSVNQINISFLNEYDGQSEPKLNLSKHCSGSKCPQIEQDILLCQQKGVKIFISLGGADGKYGIPYEQASKKLAQQIHTMFFDKNSDKVFGSATLDGIDLDLENKKPQFYDTFLSNFKQLCPSAIVSAAPQCIFPDESLNVALNSGLVDKVLIQFYNNPSCEVNNNFNYNVWDKWNANKKSKLYLGLPGNKKGAGSGYIDSAKLQSTMQQLSSFNSFGGIMFWDASLAFASDGLANSLGNMSTIQPALNNTNVNTTYNTVNNNPTQSNRYSLINNNYQTAQYNLYSNTYQTAQYNTNNGAYQPSLYNGLNTKTYESNTYTSSQNNYNVNNGIWTLPTPVNNVPTLSNQNSPSVIYNADENNKQRWTPTEPNPSGSVNSAETHTWQEANKSNLTPPAPNNVPTPSTQINHSLIYNTNQQDKHKWTPTPTAPNGLVKTNTWDDANKWTPPIPNNIATSNEPAKTPSWSEVNKDKWTPSVSNNVPISNESTKAHTWQEANNSKWTPPTPANNVATPSGSVNSTKVHTWQEGNNNWTPTPVNPPSTITPSNPSIATNSPRWNTIHYSVTSLGPVDWNKVNYSKKW